MYYMADLSPSSRKDSNGLIYRLLHVQILLLITNIPFAKALPICQSIYLSLDTGERNNRLSAS